MLKSLAKAHFEHGRKQIEMALEMEVAPRTFYNWSQGVIYLPKHRRKAFERAMRCPVDWEAYELEYANKRANKCRTTSPETPISGPVSADNDNPPYPAKNA